MNGWRAVADLETAKQRALEIRSLYARYETKLYGRPWTDEEITLGFVGDVGDLVKLVQAQNGVRAIPDVKAKNLGMN